MDQEAAGAQPSATSFNVAQLIAENAALRSKLSLTEAQRVAGDVAREQLNKFFNDAVRPSLPPPQSEERGEGVSADGDGSCLTSSSSASFPRAPVSVTIAHLTQQAESAEQRVASLQADIVVPLNTRVEALEAEKAALQQHVQTLEMKLEAQPAKPLVRELDLLRLSEGVLRDQLKSAQETAESRVEEIVAILTKGASASHELSQQTKTISELKAALRDVLHVNKFLQLEQEELRRRHTLELELRDSTHEDAHAILRDECDVLRRSLQDSQLTIDTLQNEKEAAETTCAELESEVAQLKAQRQEAAHDEESDAEGKDQTGRKRRRPELEALLEDPSSFRGEVLRFYYDGKDTIANLEMQVEDLKTKAEALRISQGRVVQLERSSALTTAHITNLATEVERLREESKQQRASVAGVEAERDILATTLAGALSGAMSPREISTACKTIREAATKAAAASAAIVADPEAIRDATRQAQELKSEVAQLQRQKEQLQRLIQLRQTRVVAQLEKDVLTFTRTRAPTSSLPLDHVLARIEQCAKDIFSASEVSAMGILDSYKTPTTDADRSDSVTPYKDSFVGCQKRMEALQKSCDEAKHEWTIEHTMHQHTREELSRREAAAKEALDAKEQALSSAHSANAALTSKLTSSTTTLATVRGQYDQLLQFTEQVLSSTRFLHQLLQSEHAYVDGLRDQVRQEREEMCDLLRATWSTASSSDAAQDSRVVAAERVASGLERLVMYLQESLADVRGRSEQETTAFVSRLAEAIREQEARVRSLESTFDEATRKQAASLLQRLTEAQQHWDSEWQRKCVALEAERDQWSRGQATQNALYRRLEHAHLDTPQSGGTSGSPADNASAHKTAVPGKERVRQTLEALEGFLKAVRRVPPAPVPSAPVPTPVQVPPPAPSTVSSFPSAVAAAPRIEAVPADVPPLSQISAAPEQAALPAPASLKTEEASPEAAQAPPTAAEEEEEDNPQNEGELQQGEEGDKPKEEMPSDLSSGYPENVKNEEEERLNTTE